MAKEEYDVLSEAALRVTADAEALSGDIGRQQSLFDSVAVKPATEELSEMNAAAEELNRYDDFSALKIAPAKYENGSGTGIYGIRRRDEVQGIGGPIILEHQSSAALRFLRELRGFGLLADVVGSGKTYEAGVVISELAVRGNVNSLLFVVPAQVYDTWTEVMEKQFGMGENVLLHIGGDLAESGVPCEKAGAFRRPTRPVIVTTEDFAAWSDSAAAYLFDVIVVDEAHNLCAEGGKYARAMKMLSMLMQTKKKAGATYCLLLTATPHTGNLANMYRLWYFIRDNGGTPSDFDEKDDSARTATYRTEKRHYLEDVCRGATTVTEFIGKVKLREVTSAGGDAFAKYLRKTGVDKRKYDKKTESEKIALADGFLDEPGNEALRAAVTARVASAYHNNVLRPIMIRQAKNPLVERRKKFVFNKLYLPTEKPLGKVTVEAENAGEVTVDLASLSGEGEITFGGETMTTDKFLAEYARSTAGHDGAARPKSAVYAMLMRRLFPYFCDETGDFPLSVFEKSGSAEYYLGRLAAGDAERTQKTEVVPVPFSGDPFDRKLAETKKILSLHKDKRVLVFFDYDLPKDECYAERFAEAIKKDKKFASRIVLGSRANSREAERKFNEKDNAVLVVLDSALTEGANLQASNIIINFQVTPDPLAMDQRIGRIFRLGQSSDVYIYSLAEMNALEGYALMYFAGIGLLSAGSGDATIISGSNSERMVAVRCKVCGNVRLYSLDDYEAKKKNDELYCRQTPECMTKDSPKGTRMDEISVWDFRCDNESCGATFTRSVVQEGYFCLSRTTDGGIMCNSGESGDRNFYCRKICAVAHCKMFLSGARKGCAALARYREKGSTVSNAELMYICESCRWSDVCCGRIDTREDSVTRCSTCPETMCSPKPGVIRFDGEWETDCPVCAAEGRKGRLRKVTAHTFAAYLRASWNFKADRSGFCYNLGREVRRGAEVRDVLRMDKENER